MRAAGSGGETGFRRAEDSTGLPAAAGLRGELINRRKVFLLEVWVFIENLRLGHARAQPPEDVPYCDS